MFEIQEDDGIEISRVPSTFSRRQRLPIVQPLRSAVSEAESEISFGTEFERVFDMEIGSITTDKSWEDMRQLLFIPSYASANGNEPDTSGSSVYSDRRGNVRRMRLYSNHDGALVPAESDLDQIFEELTEEQLAEERFMALRTLNRSRVGSGLYNTPLCSLLENYATEDIRQYCDDDESVRSESYYTRTSHDADESSPPPPPPTSDRTENMPLGDISTWRYHHSSNNTPCNNTNGRVTVRKGNKSSSLDDCRDDDTAATSLLTCSTISAIPSSPIHRIQQQTSMQHSNLNYNGNNNPNDDDDPGTGAILRDIDQFLDHVKLRQLDSSTLSATSHIKCNIKSILKDTPQCLAQKPQDCLDPIHSVQRHCDNFDGQVVHRDVDITTTYLEVERKDGDIIPIDNGSDPDNTLIMGILETSSVTQSVIEEGSGGSSLELEGGVADTGTTSRTEVSIFHCDNEHPSDDEENDGSDDDDDDDNDCTQTLQNDNEHHNCSESVCITESSMEDEKRLSDLVSSASMATKSCGEELSTDEHVNAGTDRQSVLDLVDETTIASEGGSSLDADSTIDSSEHEQKRRFRLCDDTSIMSKDGSDSLETSSAIESTISDRQTTSPIWFDEESIGADDASLETHSALGTISLPEASTIGTLVSQETYSFYGPWETFNDCGEVQYGEACGGTEGTTNATMTFPDTVDFRDMVVSEQSSKYYCKETSRLPTKEESTSPASRNCYHQDDSSPHRSDLEDKDDQYTECMASVNRLLHPSTRTSDETISAPNQRTLVEQAEPFAEISKRLDPSKDDSDDVNDDFLTDTNDVLSKQKSICVREDDVSQDATMTASSLESSSRQLSVTSESSDDHASRCSITSSKMEIGFIPPEPVFQTTIFPTTFQTCGQSPPFLEMDGKALCISTHASNFPAQCTASHSLVIGIDDRDAENDSDEMRPCVFEGDVCSMAPTLKNAVRSRNVLPTIVDASSNYKAHCTSTLQYIETLLLLYDVRVENAQHMLQPEQENGAILRSAHHMIRSGILGVQAIGLYLLFQHSSTTSI